MSENQYLEEVIQIREQIKDGEAKWEDLNQVSAKYNEPTYHIDTHRKGFFWFDLFYEKGWIKKPEVGFNNYKETYGISNGNIYSDKLIELSDIDKSSPEKILEAHGFIPTKQYELISVKNSIWNNTKSGSKNNFYSSKISVKPKDKTFTYTDIDEYIANIQFSKIPYQFPMSNYNVNGEILEINLPDLHAGLLSWYQETGEDYDIHITKKYFNKCIDDILMRIGNRKFKKIVFVTLGDILHVDNDNNTTTKGTSQQIDGRIAKVFEFTLDMLIEAIDKFRQICPVEVIYVEGNHDKILGYTLLKAVEKAFRTIKEVTFDVSPNPRKFRRFGNVLIGWLHGDVRKNNITEWLQVEAREDYGKSKYAEIHAGHIHSTQTIEKSGMIVRYLPTICASSAWEHKEAYNKGVKSIVSFVWNEDIGLREMWYSSI